MTWAVRAHEAEVAARFDLLHDRFKSSVAGDDYRLRALRGRLGALDGLRILDLGCGKGRFASALAAEGAEVIGLDRSAAMLAVAAGLDRVLASARRLPFASGAFDAVIAVEVFEHLPTEAIGAVLREARRAIKPGGLLLVVDKNAGSWNDARPWLPNLLLKWIDEKRGRWMYPSGGPVRERWFRPDGFARAMRREFAQVDWEHLLSPSESRRRLFRLIPRARRMVLWSGRVPGGPNA